MTQTKTQLFTDDERAAMQARAKEVKASAKRGAKTKGDGEADLLAKVAEMPDADRVLAEKLHALIKECAPELEPSTWYGMPSYNKDGKTVCFYQSAAKFKSRYAMLGFSDKANLDDGAMWPVYYALKDLTDTEAKAISALLRQAVS